MFIMQKFSWLSLYGFLCVLRLVVFPSFIEFQRFVNMLRMCRNSVSRCLRLFAEVFVFSSFRAVVIISFQYYLDSYCFSLHFSSFCVFLLISMVHFTVCGFRCLSIVRNSIGLCRRLFSVIFRMLFFAPFIEFLMIRQYAHNTLRFTRPITETF